MKIKTNTKKINFYIFFLNIKLNNKMKHFIRNLLLILWFFKKKYFNFSNSYTLLNNLKN